MSRVAHHSATTPQPENVDRGSRQDDQMGRSGGSQRSRCLHRLPRHQLWTRQASGTGNSSYGKKDSIQVRRVARALEILRVDLESAPSSCWGAPPLRNWMRSYVEIVYILEGSAILEAEGKPPVTLKAGEAFTTVANEVHNV